MMWIPAAQGAIAPAPRKQSSPWLMGEFVETYVRWREAAAAAKDAYDYWTAADREQRALAFMVYRAALDGEELAAGAHRTCAERIAGQMR
jgi:ribosomal protein S18 acetylase RimI-like enzyme